MTDEVNFLEKLEDETKFARAVKGYHINFDAYPEF